MHVLEKSAGRRLNEMGDWGLMRKIKIQCLSLGLLVVACALVQTSPAIGADGDHFAALRMVRFSKPVAAPNFKLKDLKGEAITFSQFKGKVVLLNFWATW